MKQVVETWSNQVVLTCPNLFKLVQAISDWIKLDQTGSNLFKLVQTCSNLFKLVQTCSNLYLTWSWFNVEKLYSRSCIDFQSYWNLFMVSNDDLESKTTHSTSFHTLIISGPKIPKPLILWGCIQIMFYGKKGLPPRRGIEPRSPAWQAGILTTILSKILASMCENQIRNYFFTERKFHCSQLLHN